jgi:hypothetical protein
MSNYDPSELPTREITIGKKSRVLAYPLPALWAFEDKTGIDLLAGASADQFGKTTRERTKTIAALMWAGLLHYEPELKFETAAGWVHLGNLTYVEEKSCEALFATLPERKEVAASAPPLEQSGPESSQAEQASGLSAVTTSGSATKSSVN